MQARVYPITMIELMYLLTSGREKLAKELVSELCTYETTVVRKVQ